MTKKEKEAYIKGVSQSTAFNVGRFLGYAVTTLLFIAISTFLLAVIVGSWGFIFG